MEAVVIVLTALSVGIVWLAPRSTALAWGPALIVLLPVFIHDTYSPLNWIFLTGSVSAVAVATVVRSGRVSRPPIWIISLILWIAAVRIVEAGSAMDIFMRIAVLAMFGSVALAFSSAPDALQSLGLAACAGLPVLAGLGFAEVFLGANAVWPRNDGVTYRIFGDNSLLPFADYRAMASTGYAITLGLLAAILLVVSVFVRRPGRDRWRWLAIFSGFAVVLLSGTRTALTILIVVAAVWAAQRLRRSPILLVATLLGGVVVLAAGDNLLRVIGIEAGFELTDSYRHRLAIAQSLPQILAADAPQMLFGHGYRGLSDLFNAGVVGSNLGISVFDNQYLMTLAALGLVGVTLLVGSIVSAARRGPIPMKFAVLAVGLSFLTYDALTWTSLFVVFVAVASVPPPTGDSKEGPGRGLTASSARRRASGSVKHARRMSDAAPTRYRRRPTTLQR